MSSRRFNRIHCRLGLILLIVAIGLFSCADIDLENVAQVDELPQLYPDYVNVTIPPNIAPLNFAIQETAKKYLVRISSTEGKEITIIGKSPDIIIPMHAWKRLLQKNRGNDLNIDIATLNDDGKWRRFQTIINPIAEEEVDAYLAYRLIGCAYNYWKKMGIYERNVETFQERPLLTNKVTDGNCMNCHNVCGNDPDDMLFHMRGGEASGMMLLHDGELKKVNTSTEFNKAGAYPSWHPNKNLIALSVNKLILFFHATGEPRDVLDMASDIIVYDIKQNMVTSSPKISGDEYMETFPCWSPAGNYLYFCRTKPLENFFTEGSSDLQWDQIRYDLARIPFDVESDTWGDVEILIDASKTGKSVTMPRVSPDGRFLLFCSTDYSNFPIYLSSSDIYLLNLETMQIVDPPINTERPETFHSWSSNSRWFVFSSKRDDGVAARPHYSYIDRDGRVSKPFVLPQKNPEFYQSYLLTYNVPEIMKKAFPVNWRRITKVAFNSEKVVKANLDPKVQHRVKNKEKEVPGSKWQAAPS